jgi:TRAP-type transport system periplasmic protein
MKRMRFFLNIATLTLCFLLVGSFTAFAGKTLKLSHLNKNDPFDNSTGAMATVFKNLVEAGTNGSIEVEIFPAGQLGKDAEVIQQVKMGMIQSSISSVGGTASVYPMIGILDMPFAFPNISTTYEVFDGEFGKKLAGDIQKTTGLKVLGFGDSGGFFAFTNSKRLVKTPKDMKGIKIRTMGLETHKTVVSAVGGQPIAVAWSEVYSALQTGVADGQMNPIPIIKFANFDEVQKYLTLSNHLFATYPWLINQKFYNSLTKEEQYVIDYAARSAIVAGRGISRIIEASERGLPALAKKMEIYSPTKSELKQFRDLAQPAVKKYLDKRFGSKGKEMLNAFLSAIKAAEK